MQNNRPTTAEAPVSRFSRQEVTQQPEGLEILTRPQSTDKRIVKHFAAIIRHGEEAEPLDREPPFENKYDPPLSPRGMTQA